MLARARKVHPAVLRNFLAPRTRSGVTPRAAEAGSESVDGMQSPPAQILPSGEAQDRSEPCPCCLAPLLEILREDRGNERVAERVLLRPGGPGLVDLDYRQLAELLQVGEDVGGELSGVHVVPLAPDLLEADLLSLFLLAMHLALPVCRNLRIQKAPNRIYVCWKSQTLKRPEVRATHPRR